MAWRDENASSEHGHYKGHASRLLWLSLGDNNLCRRRRFRPSIEYNDGRRTWRTLQCVRSSRQQQDDECCSKEHARCDSSKQFHMAPSNCGLNPFNPSLHCQADPSRRGLLHWPTCVVDSKSALRRPCESCRGLRIIGLGSSFDSQSQRASSPYEQHGSTERRERDRRATAGNPHSR